eukprot:TRINITY_DN132_c1_g2_i1.p1 TRINITY_DN132_c1_g2~~TRINITY_DN132_c1_g2_i1.p1  ORF type:complete len:159 (+),score=4.90 TRINITY_DN132_c1_g2_i1:266-742(+)
MLSAAHAPLPNQLFKERPNQNHRPTSVCSTTFRLAARSRFLLPPPHRVNRFFSSSEEPNHRSSLQHQTLPPGAARCGLYKTPPLRVNRFFVALANQITGLHCNTRSYLPALRGAAYIQPPQPASTPFFFAPSEGSESHRHQPRRQTPVSQCPSARRGL